MSTNESWKALVANEFATIEVTLDSEGNGPRLRLHDLRRGKTAFVDALLLESLIWVESSKLELLVDPGARWGTEPVDGLSDLREVDVDGPPSPTFPTPDEHA